MAKLKYADITSPGSSSISGSTTTSNSSTPLSDTLYLKPIRTGMAFGGLAPWGSSLTPTNSVSFNGSLRTSDTVMGFVREFVVEFMQKIDSTYKFVKRNHFDEKTYCETEDGEFITIGDLFDKQLKQEQDEREFAKTNGASVV